VSKASYPPKNKLCRARATRYLPICISYLRQSFAIDLGVTTADSLSRRRRLGGAHLPTLAGLAVAVSGLRATTWAQVLLDVVGHGEKVALVVRVAVEVEALGGADRIYTEGARNGDSGEPAENVGASCNWTDSRLLTRF
jgi:hypothetical protein